MLDCDELFHQLPSKSADLSIWRYLVEFVSPFYDLTLFYCLLECKNLKLERIGIKNTFNIAKNMESLVYRNERK